MCSQIVQISRPLGVTRRVVCALCPSCCPPLGAEISMVPGGGDPWYRSPGQPYKSASKTTCYFLRNCSPMGPQNLENLPPEASKKVSWKESRHHCSKAFKFDPLNLPEVGEGSQKIGFSGFQNKSANRAPKASFCEPFWLQNHSKVVPGEDPHK